MAPRASAINGSSTEGPVGANGQVVPAMQMGEGEYGEGSQGVAWMGAMDEAEGEGVG